LLREESGAGRVELHDRHLDKLGRPTYIFFLGGNEGFLMEIAGQCLRSYTDTQGLSSEAFFFSFSLFGGLVLMLHNCRERLQFHASLAYFGNWMAGFIAWLVSVELPYAQLQIQNHCPSHAWS
jgi:hypothetical protein